MNTIRKLAITLTVTAAFFLCGGFIGAAVTHAATYWASPQGSTSAICSGISGTSDPGGYGSFARAVACATNSGDKVYVKPGSYTTDITIINPSSGITIQGTDSNRSNWPVLKPTGSSVRGIHFNNITRSNIIVKFIKWDMTNTTTAASCIGSSSDAYVTNFVVEDFECLGPIAGRAIDTAAAISPSANTSGWTVRRGKITRWHSADGEPGAHCFYWQGDNGLVEYVECGDVNGYGIQYYGSGVSPNNNTVRYSKFYKFSTRGPIYIQSNSTGNEIYGNLFYDFNTYGVGVRGTNTKVWYNTIYNSGARGFVVECNSGCQITNNIIYVPGGTAISGNAGASVSNNFLTDPLFVDRANSDFRLSASSQAIGKGTTVSKVTLDLQGISRPQGNSYDIGAYEYIGNTNTSTLPAAPSSLQALAQ